MSFGCSGYSGWLVERCYCFERRPSALRPVAQ